MSNMLLEAKELHTYYGASHILHGIDFHIRQGEGIALMGRNGMGKTTLIKSMLGIVRPRHGRILVRGDDFTRGISSGRTAPPRAGCGRSSASRMAAIAARPTTDRKSVV